MKQQGRALAIAASLVLLACGDDSSPAPDAAAGGPDAAAADAATTDAAPGAWTELVGADWQLAAGEEKYVCATLTLAQDTTIGGYRPISPVGTHHTVLSYGAPQGPDGVDPNCSAGSENPLWIYASGVGTNQLDLPAGVGVKIPAGQQVHVNLHLFNSSDQPISGHSGVEILPVDPTAITDYADMFLPGPIPFSLPANQTTLSSDCTVSAPQTLVALFPHMHMHGQHFKTEIVRGGQVVQTLYDKPYSFSNQEFVLTNQYQLQAGDKIRTTCTWDAGGVQFGQSSTQEMCFSILIRYPAMTTNGNVFCTQ